METFCDVVRGVRTKISCITDDTVLEFTEYKDLLTTSTGIERKNETGGGTTKVRETPEIISTKEWARIVLRGSVEERTHRLWNR